MHIRKGSCVFSLAKHSVNYYCTAECKHNVKLVFIYSNHEIASTNIVAMEVPNSVDLSADDTDRGILNVLGENMADSVELASGLNLEQNGKKCKLSIFPSNYFSNQSSAATINQDPLQEEPEVVLHHDDFPYLNVGDVIEIYQAEIDSASEDPSPRLLLMVCIVLRQGFRWGRGAEPFLLCTDPSPQPKY